MQIIRKRAFARAGLIGNPSDGYHGKTISLIVRNYWAEVVLYDWPEVEIVMTTEDQSRFSSIRELSHDVTLHGYYGGIRLLKATIKRFLDYCDSLSLTLHDRNFSVRYSSNIPRQVGLAGSSAIIVATLRALMEFYEVEIPIEVQPALVLSVESGELRIAAGLQDRVIQCYEGLVSMDFGTDREREVNGFKCYRYDRLEPTLPGVLYLAFSTEAGEPTEVTHIPLRARYDAGDQQVVAAMSEFASLAEQGRQAILDGNEVELNRLINRNFDLRRDIIPLPASHVAMVEQARSVGASAKFAGSGGAIIGLCHDHAMYTALEQAMRALDCQVIRPIIADD
ncbi:MAG: GHMP kinase [Planctomycetota bacterium]|nr:GHMP kinase [Planctomycetota bacterium]